MTKILDFTSKTKMKVARLKGIQGKEGLLGSGDKRQCTRFEENQARCFCYTQHMAEWSKGEELG